MVQDHCWVVVSWVAVIVVVIHMAPWLVVVVVGLMTLWLVDHCWVMVSRVAVIVVMHIASWLVVVVVVCLITPWLVVVVVWLMVVVVAAPLTVWWWPLGWWCILDLAVLDLVCHRLQVVLVVHNHW